MLIRELNGIGGRTATTDAEGNFRVNGLSPANYYVTAMLAAYVTPPFDLSTLANYHRIGDTVRLELVRGGVITGMVTNSAGEPVIGVRVRVAMVRDAKGQEPKQPGLGPGFSERTTDDRGIYRIFGLPPGTYFVSAGGGTPQQYLLNPYDIDTPTYAPSSTRDTAAEVSVRSGEEANVDIRYRGEPGHVVSGTVKVANANGSTVTLTAAGGRFNPSASTFVIPGGRGFSFNGIGDGEYDLIAQEIITTPGSSSAVPDISMSDSRRITVKGADVTGIELLPKPLATMSGRVALEPTNTPECQRKRRPLMTETLITLKRPEKESERELTPFLRVMGGLTSPDAKGNFLMRNVAPGRYLFEPRFFARYWYLDSITIGSTQKIDAAATWTTVKSGEQLASVTITLMEGAASIRGRQTAAETPAGVGIYLVPAEREKAAAVLRYFVSSVDADGAFAFTNLPPGRYFVLAQPLDPQASTLAKLRLPEAAETRAKLRRAAETQKTELELKPCQNLADYKLATKQ